MPFQGIVKSCHLLIRTNMRTRQEFGSATDSSRASRVLAAKEIRMASQPPSPDEGPADVPIDIPVPTPTDPEPFAPSDPVMPDLPG